LRKKVFPMEKKVNSLKKFVRQKEGKSGKKESALNGGGKASLTEKKEESG